MGNIHVRINYSRISELIRQLQDELDAGALHQEPVCMREDCPERINERVDATDN